MVNFSNYSAKDKILYESNKLVVVTMQYEIGGIVIEEIVGLKPKMCSFLIDDNSEHEKAKDLNKQTVARISLREHKYFLFNNKCSGHSMNKIPSQNHKTRIYEINKISLSCVDDKICILNNEYCELVVGY